MGVVLKLPKRLKHANITKSHLRAPKQEKEIALRFGGKRVPGSGCAFVKGDVRLKGLLRIECKTTIKKSFTVTRDMVDKIDQAALGDGEFPAIIVEFTDNGKPTHELAVVPTWVLGCIVNMRDV